MILTPILTTAQEFDEGDGDGDDVNDEVQASINENVAAIFVIGSIEGCVLFRA